MHEVILNENEKCHLLNLLNSILANIYYISSNKNVLIVVNYNKTVLTSSKITFISIVLYTIQIRYFIRYDTDTIQMQYDTETILYTIRYRCDTDTIQMRYFIRYRYDTDAIRYFI